MKLIPKNDSEPFYIKKKWRPITLLNTDYKIAAKAIANRFKSVLPKFINNDQTGFMKGRFIGENIRLIDGINQYAAQHNTPGLLLLIDFEEAFHLSGPTFWIHYDSLASAHQSSIGYGRFTVELKVAFSTMAGQAIFPTANRC